jgi:esterase/lipase superfamily enzyme
LWRLEFHEDPEKHIVLLSITRDPENEFFPALSELVTKSTNKEAFVFIHGYDVTFADAARRTAQLAYDLGFDGAPIFYSWPSKGELKDYPADEASVEWSTPHLKSFLENIATMSHARTVHLIAHSMGNRALTAALNEISKEHAGVPAMFKQVFLAAPDIDVGVFKHLAQSFPLMAERVTLYASSKDDALIASKKFHDYPRAGESGTIIALAPRVDTIDATAVDTQFIGHSYYGDNRSILSDIFYVIRDGKPPSERFGMRPNNPSKPTYWIFRP